MPKSSQIKKLQKELELEVSDLPLAKSASDIVHGEGSVDSEIVLIGEAPGYHESVQRRPFVGRSGQLLRKTLIAVGLQPETVWISNIVKVRPPENRDPTPDEILAFRPYLDKEIEIISPKIIVTLGRFSMGKFLKDVRISQVHGRLHKIKWQRKILFILPMYHPAAALRSTKMKQSFLADFEKIKKILKWIDSQEESIQLESNIADTLL
ncbi:MAG: uracil-DNA glycosylase [Patescibacteria group bacterium]